VARLFLNEIKTELKSKRQGDWTIAIAEDLGSEWTGLKITRKICQRYKLPIGV
jgi:hypothetical protein